MPEQSFCEAVSGRRQIPDVSGLPDFSILGELLDREPVVCLRPLA
ncbi:MAG: hypothetical protein QXZ09_07450 [Candidatus Methanomethylicaceae archaeon]